MDENNYKTVNKSWNPLNYSQNLCVVSNARNGLTTDSFGANHQIEDQIEDQLSALNVQTISHNNNETQKLFSQLIQRENAFHVNQSLALNNSQSNNVLIGDNPNVKTNRENNVFDNSVNNSLLDCGDIGFNANESLFGTNSIPFMSQTYGDIKSYPQQIRSMNTTQQLSQQNANQSLMQSMNGPSVRFKSQSMPYNYNQTYHHFMDQSSQDNSHNNQTSRHLRSIRSRNSDQNTIEPINKLNYYLDKCYEQFKNLEKERKKIESDLSQAFSGQKISSANNIPIPRPPIQNATKIDRLITDMSREHAKVITIIAKMEQLRGNRELGDSIHNTVQKWLEIIRKLLMKRKDEILNNNISNGTSVAEMIVAQVLEMVTELCATTRAVRTSLWCAYINTLYGQRFS